LPTEIIIAPSANSIKYHSDIFWYSQDIYGN